MEPEATACPCWQSQLHKIGEDVSEVLDVIPAILRVLRTIRPKIRLPRLHRWRGPGEGVAAPDRERHGLDRARDSRGGLQVRLVSAAVPTGANPG
nr:IS66 family transposase zinc-finger binding domain-containing protein [Bradyrhizobium sp. 164]